MTENRHPKLARVLSRPFRFVRENCFGIVPQPSEEPIQLTEQNVLLPTTQVEESRNNVTQI